MKISVVVPAYNEEENVIPLSKAITQVLENKLSDYDYELIFIDNNSTDNTRYLLRDICNDNKKIKAILNAKNFGQFNSPFHALKQTSGDCVVLISADFQDPIDLIPELVSEWEKGYKIVTPIKTTSSESKIMWFIRSCYYKMIKKWAEYSDETEEYVISASLGYSLYNNMGGSLVDLQTKVTTLEDTVSGLQSQIDDLKTSGGGGSGGNSSTAEVAKRLEKNCSLWGQSFNGTTNVDGSVFLGKMNEGIIYVQSTPYTLRLGNIVIQANASGTELTIKNATSSTTQVALKVSGNVIGYV